MTLTWWVHRQCKKLARRLMTSVFHKIYFSKTNKGHTLIMHASGVHIVQIQKLFFLGQIKDGKLKIFGERRKVALQDAILESVKLPKESLLVFCDVG